VPEQLTPELVALAATAKELARNVIAPVARDVDDGTCSATRARQSIIEASKQCGLYHMTQLSEFGGLDSGPLALVVAREALAGENPRWFSEVFGSRPGVLRDVGEPLRTDYLLPVLAGHKRGGFGFTESRDAAHYTRAERHGNELVVNGSKSYVTNGVVVDFLNVLADIGDEGRAFLVIDCDARGVSRDRVFESLDGSQHAAFRFEDVRIPLSHMVGTPGQGMSGAMRQIADTRLLMAAEAAGRAQWVVDYLTDHIRAREKRGGIQDVTRLRYGEVRIKVFAARSTLYRAARRAESGENVVNEFIAAKAFATEVLGEVVDCAIQLVGGGALVSEHPLAVMYREARVLRVSEGLTDVLRLNIARGALELDKGVL
jgi:acyl-CoA dehydrogenase